MRMNIISLILVLLLIALVVSILGGALDVIWSPLGLILVIVLIVLLTRG